jgi:CRISPR-associated endonuclease/helicase Cas3
MINKLRLAFQEMFDVQNAHDFQVEVANQLLAKRRSVILQAPTGSGKTWTALFPFLYAWQANLAFPRKCLYAVPLRVLTEQFKDTAQEVISSWVDEIKPSIRVQTGEQQGDSKFEGDLIFTTIDQVISSVLSVPYSLSGRQANINAGAVFSSFLVCDELHLFPINEQNAQGALATLIELLRTLGDAFPFLLMTATLSDQMLKVLERELGITRVVVNEDELNKIASQQKTRWYHVVPTPLTARAVLSKHQTRSIAICNQVERAINLYDELCQAVEADPTHKGTTQIQLLHSRFIKAHRENKETTIRQQFKKNGAEQESASRLKSLIIVATQTIEVGLDITCERLHTDLAPANAIIQRAGRCARYQGEEGDVFIYSLPDDTKQPHLPYDAAKCDATWSVFSQDQYRGQALTFHNEQQIVSIVHNPTDEKLFIKMFNETYRRWLDMNAAMFRGDKEGRARLIRKVDSRTILVHNDPMQIRFPYAWRGFSLFQGTLRGWIHELQEERGLSPWMIQFPIELEVDSADGKEDDPLKDVQRKIEYQWEHITHERMLDLSPLFVVHPRLVSYDRKHGFRLKPAKQAVNIIELAQEPLEGIARQHETRYALEDYAEHIGKMLKVYYQQSTLSQQLSFVAQRLASSPVYEVTVEHFEHAVLLAIALHDVGKLQVEWQRWSHKYQQEIHEPQPEHKMIVHTHYYPNQQPLHKQVEKALRDIKRPPHAAEGAWASWPIILKALDGKEWLSQAVLTAITRHHFSFARTIEPYTLDQHSQDAIGEALNLIGLPRQFSTFTTMQHRLFAKDGALDDKLIQSGDTQQWLIYTLIVRALRLCDGKSLEGEV